MEVRCLGRRLTFVNIGEDFVRPTPTMRVNHAPVVAAPIHYFALNMMQKDRGREI